MAEPIAFIDLKAQQQRLKAALGPRLDAVLDHGAFIMGPEVKELEKRLAAFCGSRHAISCANGTDALQLALMALGIGAGDAVFTPSFTFAATAEAVALLGAVPVFVDIEPERFTMDPSSLGRAIDEARRRGLAPRAVIPVDLFGRLADYDALLAIAERHRLRVITDAAQAFGARDGGRVAGHVGDLATTSFFPAKPLGCYGDGGAVFTDDDELADRIRSLRIHGKGRDKYDNVRIGLNSRLDTLQAAILLEKLTIYEDEIERRQSVAARYLASLGNAVTAPRPASGELPVWAQYTVRLPNGVDRDIVQAVLKAAGIPTAIYYPLPLHQQTGYRDFPHDPAGLPESERASTEVLSLPMHPYLAEADQARIIDGLTEALRQASRATGRVDVGPAEAVAHSR